MPSGVRVAARIAALFALSALGIARAADPSPRTLRFDTVGVEQGLAQESVTALTQDRDGFVWLGSQGGLTRFDGHRARVYSATPGDPHSLVDNYVTALLEDRDGRLWVGTMGGLARFDPGTDGFETIAAPAESERGTGARQVRALLADRDDAARLWIGSADGLHRYDTRTRQHRSWYRGDDASGLPDNGVSSLARDASGALWIGTDAGLARLRADLGSFESFRLDSPAQPDPRHNAVRALHLDATGKLWIATLAGLERWQFGDAGPTRTRFGPEHGLPAGEVLVLLPDRDAQLWIGTRNHGLLRFDATRSRFESHRHDAGDRYSLADDYVVSLLQDRSGTLWVGTRTGGASRIDLASGGFERHTRFDTRPGSREGNKIYAIAADRDGVVWLGSASGGLHRFDRHADTVRTYRHDPSDPHSLPHDFVGALHIDARDRLWIGTHRGLARLDRDSGRFAPQWRADEDPLLDVVNRIVSDAQGRLWLGTDGGLVRHDPERGESVVFRHVPGDARSLGFGRVLGLHIDRAQRLWIGTASGLDRLAPDGHGFEHARADPSRSDALASSRIQHIAEDRQGRLWIGTAVGLHRLDDPQAARLRFRRYGRAEGLAADPIGATLEDATGRLWVSTIAGISVLDPRTDAVRNYAARDGLIDASYYIGAGQVANDGALLFGGSRGLTAFHPETIRTNPTPPQVVITELQVHNRTLQRATLPDGVEFEFPPHRAHRLRLAHDQMPLALEFAALHFADPSRNRYAYRLIGLDPGWTEVDASRRYVSYNQLAPGDYRFEVRAANKDDAWSPSPTRLDITVLPPWWATWWARSAAIALATLALWGLYRYRVRGLNRQRRWLEREVAAAVTERVRQNQAIEQAHHNLDVLGAIGREITATLEQGAVVATLDRHVHALLDATVFIIYRLAAPGDALESILRMEEGTALPDERIALVDPVRHAARCARERCELALDFAPGQEDASHVPGTLRSLSALFAPLVVGERLLGVMTIQSPRRQAYGERERVIFRSLCAYGAIALDNAATYLQLQATDERLQRALREQRLILDNVAAAVFLVSAQRIQRCNRGMEEMLGYDPGELIGCSTRTYHVDEAAWQAQEAGVAAAIAAGEVAEGECEVRRKDGERFWIAYRSRAVDPHDAAQGTIWIAQDISERKRTEAELDRIRREQQIIFDNSPGGGILLTRDRMIVGCNPGLERLLRYEPGTLAGHSARVNFPSDEAYERFGRWAYPILAAGGTAAAEVEYQDRDGAPIPAYVSGKAIDPHDLSQGVVWMATDLRQQKQDAAALDRARRELQLIFDNDIGAIVVVREGCIERCSRGFLTMYGYAEHEVAGMPVEAFSVTREESQALARQTQPDLAAGKVVSGEFRYLRKDGSIGWLLYQGRALQPPDLAQGTIWLCQDISEIKRQEAALRDSKTRVERSLQEVEQLNRQVSMLGEMSGFLQACPSADEAYACIASFGPRLFAGSVGVLFLREGEGATWHPQHRWGSTGSHPATAFDDADCWALRRSRAYRVDAPDHGLRCPHLGRASAGMAAYACLPLTAMGKTFGLLHIGYGDAIQGDAADRRHGVAVAMAEQIALALANLQLREALLRQSMCDPLTGVFNRRHLQEALPRELARCRREQAPLSVLMLDVDHFKQFNDRHGHAAGDLVLKEVARAITRALRSGDVACRYGGEEFALILPDADADAAQALAERLLASVRALELRHEQRALGRITASIGVASFPRSGEDGEAMLDAADAALYRAKQGGRDRVALDVALPR